MTDELIGGTVTIEVNNRQEERVSSNVIGVLRGSEEPDRCRSNTKRSTKISRYVMLENAGM